MAAQEVRREKVMGERRKKVIVVGLFHSHFTPESHLGTTPKFESEDLS